MAILAGDVRNVIGKYMLADGKEIIPDLEKSHGSYLVDARDGKEYLDFFTFFASLPIGHNHPKMKEPAFLEKLHRVAITKPSLSDLYPVEMAEFVETFARVAKPDYMKHLFFISGGALAVENALKTAFDWKTRKNFFFGRKKVYGDKVIHFRQAFHGRTGYTLSLTNTADPRKTKFFPTFDWPRVLNPKVTFPLNEENLKKVKSAEEESLRQIKDAILEHGETIAAIIIEPIQGEGGDNHFRGEFLRALREMADENEILLIFDEVQTGVGITGKMWAHQHFDVKPDIFAFGKKTQVCGIMAGLRIDEVENNVFVESSRLNSTWGGNLVDMVRAQRYFEIIEEDNLVENARVQGEYLLKGLNDLAGKFPELMSNVRGRGLFCAFDMPTPALRDKLLRECENKGMLILGCGELSVRFRPPLTVSQDEIGKALDIIESALNDIREA